MTFKRLFELSEEMNKLIGRKLKLRGQNSVVALFDDQGLGSQYSPWMTNQEMARWMDAVRRGYRICEQQYEPKMLAYRRLLKET